jgi:carbamoyl-phosphate synthase large subunit
MLTDLGLTLLATRGTAAFLAEHGIASDTVNKAYEGGRPSSTSSRMAACNWS